VQAAAEFIRSMGYEKEADNILTWLVYGKLYWDPKIDGNGETGPVSGDITILELFIHSTQNEKAKNTPFDPDKDFDKIASLARVLFHEKIHAHQSYWFTHFPSQLRAGVGGKNAEEYEAWTQTIKAMDLWILTLIDKYKEIPADKKKEQIDILKKILTLISQKKSYLSDFKSNNNYHGYGDDNAGDNKKVKDKYQELEDKLKEVEERVRKELERLEKLQEVPSQPPKEAKSALPDPERLLKQVAEIEQVLERNAPERIPRDDEVEFRITPRPNSGDQILDLYFVNKSDRAMHSEIPVGMPIGRPDSTRQVMVTVQRAVLNYPPNSSVTVPLLVRNVDRAQYPLLNSKEILYVTLPESPSPTQATNSALVQGTAGTQLIGLVYDKNTRSGDQATISITTNPKKYEDIPGIGVIEIKCVDCQHDSSGQVSLSGLIARVGDSSNKPASQPITFHVPKGIVSIPVTLSRPDKPGPIAPLDFQVPARGGIARSVYTKSSDPGNFTTPPVVQNTSLIRGPLSGDGNVTRIMVDDLPATILAESPTTVYFDLPPETSTGPHQLAIQDGTSIATFPIIKMGITGHIDQPSLQRGQKTNYSVTLNFGPMAQASWQSGGGSSPELINLAQVQRSAPGFHVPQTGEPGVILLAINNASRSTVSIIPSQDERLVFSLHQQDFQNNQFTTRGEIQSKVTGTFTIDLLAQGFFAPIGGQQLSLASGFSKIFCPNKCTPAGLVPGSATTDVSITPQGFAPGDIDKMKAGVSVINNVPMPAAGKQIQAATTALLTGAFGAAEALAKRNGVTIWVRVSCKVCELENCLSIQRLNVHDHHSGWEKVMDLVQLNKNGGATMEANYDAAGIAAEIAAKAATHTCP